MFLSLDRSVPLPYPSVSLGVHTIVLPSVNRPNILPPFRHVRQDVPLRGRPQISSPENGSRPIFAQRRRPLVPADGQVPRVRHSSANADRDGGVCAAAEDVRV
jgi:hypothetical protein